MITSIIVDDEAKAREGLRKLLDKYCPEVSVIGMASSVDEAVTLISARQPELVFLDIEMPNGNGFTLFERVKTLNFEIIFTTAYEEYAIKAFRTAAIDYLTKPIDFRHLQEAVLRFKSKQKVQLKQQQIQLLIENISNNPKEFNKIALPAMDGYTFVKIAEIVNLEAEGNYTNVFMLNNEKLLVSKTMKWFGELLPQETFYRCHKSHIVNLNLIKKFTKADGNQLLLENGRIIDVSERNKK
ncbi:MAG: LytTR family DNA-binding domain-containing protein, partial [Bacteroidota bacterium]|nr:LytTR family DNA-binding domain-containing protein [Bacteroidota bacterium]